MAKIDFVEGLLREYDLFHFFKERKEVSLAKQKLIFYLSYMKSGDWNQ